MFSRQGEELSMQLDTLPAVADSQRDPATLATSYEPKTSETSRQYRTPHDAVRRASIQPGTTRMRGVFGEGPPPAVPAAPASSRLQPVPTTEVFGNFLKIPLREYKMCDRFVEAYPRVLDENTSALQKTAMAYYARGDAKSGDRCVERLLMVRGYLQNGDEYLYNLRRRENKIADFEDDFEQTRTALIKASATVVDSSPPAPIVAKDNQSSSSAAYQYEPMKSYPSDQASLVDDTASLKIGGTSIDRRSSIAGDAPGSYPMRGKLGRTQSQGTAYAYGPKAPMFETREPDSKPVGGRLSADTIETLGQQRTRGDKTSNLTKSSLHKNYWVRKDAKSFFVAGRVFKVLWHQPGGANIHGQLNTAKLTAGAFGEPVYSTLRWMMVIKQKDGYSLCCPISTYGGNGLTNKKLSEAEVRAHAIVYQSESRAKTLSGEPRLPKEAIEVVLADEADPIHVASRVHFGKCYTVEWNIKVMNIGMVTSTQIPKITAYFIGELGYR